MASAVVCSCMRLTGVVSDVLFALRLVRADWRFSITLVATLAVGIAKAWMDQQYGTEKKSEKSCEAPKTVVKEGKGKLAPVV